MQKPHIAHKDIHILATISRLGEVVDIVKSAEELGIVQGGKMGVFYDPDDRDPDEDPWSVEPTDQPPEEPDL